MAKYDYKEAVLKDLNTFFLEGHKRGAWEPWLNDHDALKNYIQMVAQDSVSVTGNEILGYRPDEYNKRQKLIWLNENQELVEEVKGFYQADEEDEYIEYPEFWDVLVRSYTLPQVMDEFMQELEYELI